MSECDPIDDFTTPLISCHSWRSNEKLREIEQTTVEGIMESNAEPEHPVPSFLPFPVPAADTDAFIDELYFGSDNAEGALPPDSAMNELNESRTELYNRVQALKKDLKDWRGMLNSQVKSYREEIGGLRDSLNSEVERLKTDFKKLRSTMNDQMEKASCKLAELDEFEETVTSSKPINPTQPLSIIPTE